MATTSSASLGDTMYRGRRRGFNWLAWIWVGPALILEIVFFVYPLINTVVLSFQNGDSTSFVGLKNYQAIFTDPHMLEVLRNNIFWLVFGTILTVGLGLIIAVLVDKVKIETAVKSAIFIPMAISFVGASVIWRFVYDYQPPGQPQIGLLNALLSVIHIPAQTWLQDTRFNNFATLTVYVWMWTGFSMVILSAALKGIPEEIVEAARIDGASRIAMFWRITVPLIMPTLAVVTTTAIINLLKIFDVVYVMTGGKYHTSVIGMEFYTQLFSNQNYGLASALAVVLLVTIIPVMYINIRRIRAGGTN